MKSIDKKWGLILGTVSLFILSNNANSQENLFEIAQEISKVHELDTSSMRRAREQKESVDTVYKSLDERFNQLTISQKNEVIEIKREINEKETRFELGSDEMILKESLKLGAKLAEEDNIFFGDLPESEMERYVRKARYILTDQDLSPQKRSKSSYFGNCSYKQFPEWINAKAHPYVVNIYRPYTYTYVKNDLNETFCDYELWFSTSKENVWGTSWAARKLLEDFGDGLSKRTYKNKTRLIAGRLRTMFWLQTGYRLSKRIIIW